MLRANRPLGPYVLAVKIPGNDEQYEPIMYAAIHANTTVRKILELLLLSCLEAIKKESESSNKPAKSILREELGVGDRKSWMAKIKARWNKLEIKSNDTASHLTHTLFLDRDHYDYLGEISLGLATPDTIAVMILERIVCHSYSWSASKKNNTEHAGIELVNYIRGHGY